jgi:hypothetical protein
MTKTSTTRGILAGFASLQLSGPSVTIASQRASGRWKLFDGNRLGQIAGLIHIRAL